MANEKHVKLLKQGTTVWNAWREKNYGVQPDLSYTDLVGVNLSSADLFSVNLSNADLSNADLTGVNLVSAALIGTNLSNADLTGAHLRGANLRGADLTSVNLSNADLSNAGLSYVNLSNANLFQATLRSADLSKTYLRSTDLSNADLSYVNLSNANLRGANFSRTRIGFTIFAWVDLSAVKGLDTVFHSGPSIVDVKTVQLPEGETHLHFLRGTGFSDTFIDYQPSLFSAAIQYASCFISYAHQDETLAQRLYKDLQGKGVRCWFAPHDLRPGDYHHSRIDEAIHLHENTLLLLSEHAVKSSWVKHEVQIALAREIAQDRIILFPLRLDEAIHQAHADWASRLRDTRHIGDFTLWQEEANYQQRFAELLRHLKVKTI